MHFLASPPQAWLGHNECCGQPHWSLPPMALPPILLPLRRSQFLVAFMGAYLAPNDVALVTELCPGGTLWSAISSQRITWHNGCVDGGGGGVGVHGGCW